MRGVPVREPEEDTDGTRLQEGPRSRGTQQKPRESSLGPASDPQESGKGRRKWLRGEPSRACFPGADVLSCGPGPAAPAPPGKCRPSESGLGPAICGLTSPPGDSDAHLSLRTTL